MLQNWGEYMTEASFNWRMMKNIFTELHVYDEVRKRRWTIFLTFCLETFFLLSKTTPDSHYLSSSFHHFAGKELCTFRFCRGGGSVCFPEEDVTREHVK